MGFLSKVFKGVKNIFKGVGKVVKKVFKEVKRFAKSDIGKLVIGAALIYAGGVAAGAWGGSGATAATTATTELAASTIPAGATTAVTATAPEIATAAMGGAGQTLAATAPEIATAAMTGGTQAATGGLLSKAGAWMAANPIPTMIGGQMLSAAFTPSQAEEYAALEEERRKNMNVAGYNYAGEGSPINLGLVRRAQQQDLQTPTYHYDPSGAQNG